jgi:pimeloyl-ACP methyl ester carboxylesterase
MVQSTTQPGAFPKIGAPALRALHAAGYNTLEELTQARAADLAKLHGMGPKALGILREALAAKGLSFAGEEATNVTKDNYAAVNGIRLYYEIHGKPLTGQPPLVLLHGGLGLIEMMSDLLTALAKDRQVIGVDLQAHGRTVDIDRPIRYESSADDIAALIHHLGHQQADVMGYSFGGGVALRVAIQHPDLVRKLVLISTPFRQAGWFPEIRESMNGLTGAAAEFMRETPMYQSYVGVAPQPENFPQLLDKMGDLMRQANDSTDDIAGLPMPVMLIYGDADSIPPSHAAEFFALLGGGQRDADWDGSGMTKHRLAILPGLTHYTVFASPLVATVVTAFLAEG